MCLSIFHHILYDVKICKLRFNMAAPAIWIYISMESESATKCILVVDDTDSNRSLLSILLIRAGYNVISVPSGKEALNACSTHSIDLCLVDVKMPEMSGFDFVDHLKKDGSTASIPFVFVSSNDDKKSMLQGIFLGAIDYIAKPISPKHFIRKVNYYFDFIEMEKQITNGL